MSPDSAPLVVVVGPHCAGKTTLGRRIADALGWTFDVEIGDDLYKQARANNQLSPDDADILDAETARDAASGGRRVCESWHVGNIAWAQHRSPRISDWPSWRERAEAATVAAMRERPVIFVVVECDETVRRQRRAKSGVLRLPPFGDMAEEDFVELTRTVGHEAQRWIERLCSSNESMVRIRTDVGTVEETVQKALEQIRAALLPPLTLTGSPHFFDSCAAALCLLRRAASLDAALRHAVDRCESSLLQPTELATPVRCGVPVITVDGLDGCGKSTVRYQKPNPDP